MGLFGAASLNVLDGNAIIERRNRSGDARRFLPPCYVHAERMQTSTVGVFTRKQVAQRFVE